MYNFVMIDPFNDSRWDQFVKNHPFGWISHLSSWKYVIEQSFKHIKGYYLTLTNETNNKILAALPLFEVKSWLTGNRLVNIPFATISDPLISNSQEMNELFDAAKQFAGEHNITNIEIRTFKSSDYVQNDQLEQNMYFKQHYICLNNNLDDIKKSFHRRCVRKRINQSLNSDLKLRIADNEKDMLSFYKIYLTTRKRLGLPPQPYKYFKNLWQTFFPLKHLELLLAELNGKPIAGLILLKFRDRVSAEIMGYEIDYLNLHPNHFLFWHSIKSAVEEGYKIYDFGRTSIFNESLMTFKNRWGTKVRDLPIFHYSKNKKPAKNSREQSKTYSMVRNVCQKMPVPLFQAFGNFCYHHLS